MHEGARQLDQPFEKQSPRTAALREPERFQNLVRLEEKLTIEAFKIAQIMGVESPSFKRFDDGRYLGALFAHELSPRSAVRSRCYSVHDLRSTVHSPRSLACGQRGNSMDSSSR